MPAKKILIVDDEQELVKAVRIRLEQEGYEVLIAYDGMEGLRMVKNNKPDLIILDVLLPKIKGDSVANNLKEDKETCGIPIILLTCLAPGVTSKSTACFEDGHLLMGKPFDTEELLSLIKDLLESEQH